MKKLLLFVVALISLQCNAQKNICHLIYELSTVDAGTLGTLSEYVESSSQTTEEKQLKKSFLQAYQGVKEVELKFNTDITDADNPGRKLNKCTATIKMANFNLNQHRFAFDNPKKEIWTDNPMKDTIFQMFERAYQYISQSCFSTQQLSYIIKNEDDKNTLDPRYTVYLYDKSIQLPNGLNHFDAKTFFYNKPFIKIEVKQQVIGPMCNMYVQLNWFSEKK